MIVRKKLLMVKKTCWSSGKIKDFVTRDNADVSTNSGGGQTRFSDGQQQFFLTVSKFLQTVGTFFLTVSTFLSEIFWLSKNSAGKETLPACLDRPMELCMTRNSQLATCNLQLATHTIVKIPCANVTKGTKLNGWNVLWPDLPPSFVNFTEPVQVAVRRVATTGTRSTVVLILVLSELVEVQVVLY